MRGIQYKNTGCELVQTVEFERLMLDTFVDSEIAIVLKMADSPLIRRHFLEPGDNELRKIAYEEFAGYRKAFTGNIVFWVNDADKKFFFNDSYVYTIDTSDPDTYWYPMTLNKTSKYNFNINYNPDLNITNLWINAPVFDSRHRPVGMVGTGVNLFDFVNAVYQSYHGASELYLFNMAGEITGANDVSLIENKVKISEALGQTGIEIQAAARGLKNNEIKYFRTKDKKQITAVGSIPALNWYVTVIRSFSVTDTLQTGMTILFGIMMIVIFSVFVVFNIFIVGMLEPLNRMVKTVNKTLSDWELTPLGNNHQKDEIGTLGEFINMTIIDPLTGIYNRRYLDGHWNNTNKSRARTNSSLSLLMIDIDYFKKYNDNYGHDAGDNCLRTVTSALTQCITRDEDFVARYGGEEFVVVLPNANQYGARIIGGRLLSKIEECNIPHIGNDIADHVTISIGATTGLVTHLQRGSDYVKAADKALYESKKNGRNRYTFVNFEG
jgi:diguanylate cyclase (GGDEF)-like protein